ncbi:MAG TPA: GGDEF domain-containing protein [Gaiellaceae bacterium]|nr:GGDEF domain-containing protein [Gaiellaceae bacterium]
MRGSRGLAVGLAACAYAAVFGAFVALERPGLGIGHFFYVPVCLVALATDALAGGAAGLLAGLLYVVAVQAAPHVVSAPLTPATAIRTVTFTAVGVLVGWFAGRNRQLVDRLSVHARTDFVTGVANVRAFDGELNVRCGAGQPFTLVLLDVDGLRRVNEIHGHTAGDGALRRVAAALLAAVEAGDAVARVGGDEFAVLTSLPPERVPGLVAHVNAALAPADLSVTAAATSLPADGEAPAELFRKADDRLFAAKLVRGGRATLAAV